MLRQATRTISWAALLVYSQSHGLIDYSMSLHHPAAALHCLAKLGNNSPLLICARDALSFENRRSSSSAQQAPAASTAHGKLLPKEMWLGSVYISRLGKAYGLAAWQTVQVVDVPPGHSVSLW